MFHVFEENTRIVLYTTAAVVISSYVFLKWFKQLRYFQSLNIPSGPTPFPLVGSVFQIFKNSLVYFDIMVMSKYAKKNKVVGYFEGSTPVILCTDPEMIKQVMIKDFSSFVNRRTFEAFEMDPFDKMILSLKDDEWKNVRSIITTTFTSGKLKGMTNLIIQRSNAALKYIENLVASDQYLDVRDIFSTLTIDTIGSCAFGLHVDAFNDPNNEFTKHINKFLKNTLSAKTLLIFLMPKFSKYAAKKEWVEFFPSDTLAYLEEVVKTVMQRRREKLDRREDFIQIMVDHEELVKNEIQQKEEQAEHQDPLEQGSGTHWKHLKKTLTTKEILSQALVFLIAGSDTTATCLLFTAYNLAKYPDYQKRLCLEIDEAYQRHGSLSYDMVNSIPYLDMVISESLRIHPPALRLDRIASSDYVYKDIQIPKGTVWSVPIYCLHHDPDLYPDPEIFNPERFTPEVRRQRENDGSYIPFGSGPRNCVGMRFAMLEVKVFLCTVLSEYEFVVCDKTPVNKILQEAYLIKNVILTNLFVYFLGKIDF